MSLLLSTFGRIAKPLFNIGLGQIPWVHTAYKFAWGHFGPKGVRLTEVNDFQLYVFCHDWAVAPAMLFAHTWEPAETEICRRYIKEGMTVVDAGAYIGYYSVLASKLIGDSGKVYAFEPSPKCLDLLYLNILINNCWNVQVVKKAVADESGCTTFYLSPHNLSGSTMFENYSTPRNVHNPRIKVPVTTLDEVIGDEKVDFIKMDVEGGETRALKGMTEIIKNNPDLKMIIEVFPLGLEEIGSSLEEFVDLLQRNFRLYVIGKNGTTDEVGLADIQEATKKTAVINLLCCGKGSQQC